MTVNQEYKMNVQDWPDGQIAEIDWWNPYSRENLTGRAMLRRRGMRLANAIWQTLDREDREVPFDWVSDVRPLRLVPQDAVVLPVGQLVERRIAPAEDTLAVLAADLRAESPAARWLQRVAWWLADAIEAAETFSKASDLSSGTTTPTESVSSPHGPLSPTKDHSDSSITLTELVEQLNETTSTDAALINILRLFATKLEEGKRV